MWIVWGLVVLTGGAEVMLRGAVGTAKATGMPTLIIELTVVAYGTRAPGRTVSIKSAFTGQADLVIGNRLGSNVFNALCIPA